MSRFNLNIAMRSRLPLHDKPVKNKMDLQLDAYLKDKPMRKNAKIQATNLICDALGDSYYSGDHQKVDADVMRRILTEFLVKQGWSLEPEEGDFE